MISFNALVDTGRVAHMGDAAIAFPISVDGLARRARGSLRRAEVIAVVHQLAAELGRRPWLSEICEVTGASESTARRARHEAERRALA